MKLSNIVQSATLTLLVSAFSLLGPRLASADAQEDLHTANLRVDAFHDAAGDLHRLPHDEAARQADRIEEARRAADEAQDALNKTRWAIADEFQRGQIHIEEAKLLEQYLMKAEAEMREANRWMGAFPAPAPAKDGSMTVQDALDLLNADADALQRFVDRAQGSYDYDHAEATIQAAFDKRGVRCKHADAWGGWLYTDLLQTVNRLVAAKVRVRGAANLIAHHPNQLNAGYVRYLHDSMKQLNADAERFFTLSGRIVDGLASEGLALDHGNEKHLVGDENKEYTQALEAQKATWKEITEAHLFTVPQSLADWSAMNR